MRVIRSGAAVVLCVSAAVALGACGDDESDQAAGAKPATDGAAATNGMEQSSVDLAVKFTGGKSGKADDALDPVVVGVVNQQGGTPAFPEYLKTAEAAAKFVNADLGGVGGHPIKLESCIVNAEEDGQKCAAEFLGKDIDVAIWTLGIVGNQSFYQTVGGKFPVLVSAAATGPDSATPNVYEFDGGASSTLNAMAVSATNDGEKSVAVVATGNPSGKYTTGEVLVPMLKKIGVNTKVAYYPDTATIPEMVAAVQASGAASADSVIFNPAAAAQCNSVYDAMKQLGVKKKVVTSAICSADEVAKHTNGGPEGWELASYASSSRVDDDAAGQAFKNALETYGAGDAVNSGYTIKVFGDVLAVTKFANQIGPDKLSAEAFDAAIKGFTGPAFGVPGELECGYDKAVVSVCGKAARMSAVEGGKWVGAGDIALP